MVTWLADKSISICLAYNLFQFPKGYIFLIATAAVEKVVKETTTTHFTSSSVYIVGP